ncbi:hypothetical protein JCM11251_005613 [Rhodosporidiobolus azoricus]
MAYNGMPQLPSVSQRSLAITVSQFSSFATPAITVPFPSAYGGQTQIPFAWTGTATWAATRVPTTLGGVAATAGVHSIYSEASAAGYRTHDYGNQGGGGGWPTWATAVIAACGGAAVVILIAGLFCWRWRRKQRARKDAQAYAVGGAAAVKGGKKRRSQKDGGGGFIEKSGSGAGGPRDRRSRVPEAAFAAVPTTSPTKSRSRSRQGGRDSPASYPPLAPGISPSRSRARDAAALGINRPSSASPSPYRQSPYDQQTSSGYDSPVYPAFAIPRGERNHHRDFSGSSANELLPPAAGFAYVEGSGRNGYETPPPRVPNTNWEDSPGATGSPARLLASPHGRHERGAGGGRMDGLNTESPRSSFTVSTRGTGGAPYRWDQDPDLSNHMPDPDEVGAALGRAMMVPADGDGFEPVGVAVGSPDDTRRWVGSDDHHSGERMEGYRERSYGSGGAGMGGLQPTRLEEPYNRSTTPSYPPPASSPSNYSASRAPSRQTGGGAQPGAGMPSYLAPSAHSKSRSNSPAYGEPRSTTPQEPPSSMSHDESRRTRLGGGEVSRASTYMTAEDGNGTDDSAEERPSRSYAARG